VVDRGQPGRAGRFQRVREFVRPHRRAAGGVDKVEQAAADPAHAGDRPFVRPDRLFEAGNAQRVGAGERTRHIVHREANRADRGAVDHVEAVRQALRLAVDHQVENTLLPARDVLAAVARGGDEAQRAQHGTSACASSWLAANSMNSTPLVATRGGSAAALATGRSIPPSSSRSER
jgi:hypothetical protein